MNDLAPRWLDPEDAARYIGVRVDELPRLAKAGKLPSPSRFLGPRKPRYDRLQLDALFDPGQANSTQDAANAAVQAILSEAKGRQKAAR
jgi:hypothetical protein